MQREGGLSPWGQQGCSADDGPTRASAQSKAPGMGGPTFVAGLRPRGYRGLLLAQRVSYQSHPAAAHGCKSWAPPGRISGRQA